MKVLLFLTCLVLAISAAPGPRNDLTCTICIDFVTDFDTWLTSDKTEADIVTFVEELCHAVGQIITGFEATCNFIVESQLPGIIDDLVNNNLDPLEVCTNGALMGSCP
eukprot:GFUD01131472.1.p2 GENE.GFUD01131472.1~~GFUD01131472.1.p2  ORF type:complete len:108 (+),score=26.82 GFUD01131472.1:13-336(+)